MKYAKNSNIQFLFMFPNYYYFLILLNRGCCKYVVRTFRLLLICDFNKVLLCFVIERASGH